LALILILVFLPVGAQEHDVFFSGNLDAVSFSEFVGLIEEKTDARFFYLEDWIKEITISVSGEDISVQKTLSVALQKAGLYFYINQYLEVFITPGQEIITVLPDYSMESSSAGILAGTEADKELSNIQQRYIEGRKAGLRETIVVGSGTGNGGSCCIWEDGRRRIRGTLDRSDNLFSGIEKRSSQRCRWSF